MKDISIYTCLFRGYLRGSTLQKGDLLGALTSWSMVAIVIGWEDAGRFWKLH